MKRLFKVFLPAVIFLAIAVSSMLIASSCSADPGEKCSDCDSNSDCDSGLSCYSFTNGDKKCAESAGDLCSAFSK